MTKELDLDTLEPEQNSFVKDDLTENLTDIVYRCRLKGGEYIWISFLFEHKSYYVKFIFLQLLQYLINGWSQMLRQKMPLRLIIPIVVYHGEKEWKKREVADFFTFPNEYFKRFIPNFDYLLTDISRFSQEDLKQMYLDARLFTTIMAFRFGRDKNYIINHLGEILYLPEEFTQTESGENFLGTIIVYLCGVVQLDYEEILYSVENLKEPIKKVAMTTLERIENRGMQKKTILAIENMLRKKKVDELFIADVLDVTVEEVLKVKKEMEAKGEL